MSYPQPSTKRLSVSADPAAGSDDMTANAEVAALSIRNAAPGNEAALAALFAEVHGRSIDTAHWRWKLQHSGVPNVWLAASGDRAVFQYAGIPISLGIDGKAAHAMVSVDTMTSPDFRRRGLLTHVARRAYAGWKEAGIDLVIGLPNEQWGSRTAALGWQPIFPLRWLALPLRPEALLARQLAMPALQRLSLVSTLWRRAMTVLNTRDASIEVRRVSQAGPELDVLWSRCKDNARFAVVRDRRWVQWRFLDAPSRHYEVRLAMRSDEPVGYAAFYVDDGRSCAYLAEISCPSGDVGARDALLADIVASLPDVELLSTLAVPGTSTYRWLRHRAFLARKAFQVQMVPLSANLPLDAMSDPAQWELGGAAFDVI